MNDTDRGTFDRAFRRVVGAFRVRLKADELGDLSLTYFRILEHYPLDRVLLAAKACMSTSKKFPLAADWLAELATNDAPAPPPDVRHLTVDELDAYDDAKRDRWSGQPCLCWVCVRANVDDRPLRYVPTPSSSDTYERGYNPRTNAVQVIGHWAHGEELAAWYDARERFYRSAPPKFRGVLRLVAMREIGEEG